jgi:CheY-like chemotaxis protein
MEAAALCTRHHGRIDLLVTDVVMPRLNGRELATVLKGLRPEMQVLYISGYTNEHVDRLELDEAADGFLAKPFTPAALAQKVRELLDRRTGVAGLDAAASGS